MRNENSRLTVAYSDGSLLPCHMVGGRVLVPASYLPLSILPVPGTRVHTLRAAAAALEEETWIFAHIKGSLAHSVRVRQCGCVNILNLYRVLTPSLINSYRPFGRATPLSQDRYPTASQEERCLLQPIQQQQQKKVRVPTECVLRESCTHIPLSSPSPASRRVRVP